MLHNPNREWQASSSDDERDWLPQFWHPRRTLAWRADEAPGHEAGRARQLRGHFERGARNTDPMAGHEASRRGRVHLSKV